MKKALKFLSFLSFGLFVFYLVYQNQNSVYKDQCAKDGILEDNCNLIDKLISDFGTIDLFWLTMVVAAFSLSNVLRAKRWQMQFLAMGHQVQFKNTFWSIHLGYFANLGIPRMGEVLRAGVISKFDGIPMEKSIGSLVIDRLADLICLALLIASAFVLEFDTLYDFVFGEKETQTQTNSKSSLLAFSLLFIIPLLFFLLFRKKIQATSIYRFASSKLKGFWDGIISIKNLDKPLTFSFLSIGIWVLYYIQCLFTMWSFPPTAHLSGQAALMVFTLGTLGFLVPTPGSMGSYHALAIAALALYGIEGSDAFTFSNISFLVSTISYNVIMGTIALFLLPRINKSK